jgi:SAM-dependent methyltransferase
VRPDPRSADLLERIVPLSPDEYYKLVFRFDDAHYRSRVEMVGFTGAGRVLDAGCGYGQWAAALAAVNDRVIGVDVNPNMVEISRMLCREHGLRNADFEVGQLPRLRFADEEFDLIWCWGVIMFVDRALALREFNRLLKPGGRLLVGCANGRGRWLYKALRALHPRRFRPATARTSLKALLQAEAVDTAPNRSSREGCHDLCRRFGFEAVAAGFDGTIDLTGPGRERPMFPARFLGLENNIEYVARKVARVDDERAG